MRVILIGDEDERDALRAQINGSASIVGEFPTLGEARASQVDADAVVSRLKTAATYGPHEALTPRETQVLDLLAQGLANKGIAARLAISEQTVKFHVASIAGKLGAANRTDVVRRALRQGLIAI